MASGVSTYAGLNARVRVMYSHLLGASTLAALGEASDLQNLVLMLKRTAYGSQIEALKERELTSRTLVLAFKRRLAEACESLIRTAPLEAHGVLAELYKFYEVNNLKAVLRAIAVGAARPGQGLTWDEVRPLLFPTEYLVSLPAQAMVESGNIAAAVELLRGTAYYEPLSFGLKRYSVEQSLFPLEVALDLSYWRRVWGATRRLMGEDQSQAVRVVGSLVDTNNLMWAIRYRVYHRLSEEELINYTLAFGLRVRDDDVRSIASGSDIGGIVGRVFPGLPRLSEYLAEPRTGLPGLELELKRYVMRQCLAEFVGNPFHVGMPLAYFVLHDLEIQDLTVLVEAKAAAIKPVEFRPLMLRTAAIAG